MSFNGSGTYVPPAGQPVASGTVIQSSTFNGLVTDIGNTFNNVLPRDGQAAMAAQLKLIDGTSSVPGIAFNSEASTGMFRPTTGMLALVAQGVENLRINSAGRVLIGTTTDDGTNKLQVNGATKVTGALAVTGALSITGASTAASYSGPLTGNVTGNVSGNAANVTGTVAVANGGTGATSAVTALTNLGAAPIASPTFTGTVSGVTATMVGLGNVTNTSDANKPVSTAQQTALNLKANAASPTFTGNSAFAGDVNIGATSPGYASFRTLGVGGAAGGAIDFMATSVGVGSNRVAQIFGAGNGYLGFSVGTNDGILERMRIAPSGALLLNTTTDNGTDKLQVNGSVNVSGAQLVGGNIAAGSASGNLYAAGRGLNLTSGVLHYGSSTTMLSMQNLTLDATGGAKYAATGVATAYGQVSGAHTWIVLPSAAAGAAATLTAAMTLTNASNVLIGTTTDDGINKLQVTGSAKLTGNLTVGTATMGGGTSTFYADATNTAIRPPAAGGTYFQNAAGTTTWGLFAPSGNLSLGSGADNGVDRLQVTGSSSFYSGVTINAGNDIGYSMNGGLAIQRKSGDALGFLTASTERMRIMAAGNVLIGTTTDNGTDKLQVNGSVKFTDNFSIVNPALTIQATFDGKASGTNGGSAVATRLAGVTSMAIGNKSAILGGAYDSTPYLYANSAISTNVGMVVGGTTTANSFLSPFGGGYTIENITTIPHYGLTWQLLTSVSAQGAAAIMSGYGGVVFGAGGSERMRLSYSGNMLIGSSTDNGTDKLQVTGSTKVTGLLTGGGGAFNGNTVPSSGTAVEILHDGTIGVVQSYSRSAGAYKALGINALSVAFGTGASAAEAMRIDATGNLLVGTTASNWGTAGRGLVEINGTSTALLGLKVGNAAAGYLYHDGTNLSLFNQINGNLTFSTNAATRMVITGAGVIQDAAGNELGYKDAVQNIQGSAYTLVVGDRGKSIVINAASSAMTIPASVFSGGAVVTIYNNSGSAQSIVQGTSLTMKYGTGASPLTGNRTLANNGICTIYFVNSTTASISGNGVT